MPPAYAKKDALKEKEVDLLRRWIAEGAKWQPFWSFAPPHKPDLPPVQQASWPHNPIDRFLLARMERENLHPAPEADPAIILRRVSLDLTGLPPDPSELALFLADPTPAAYEGMPARDSGTRPHPRTNPDLAGCRAGNPANGLLSEGKRTRDKPSIHS